MIIIFSNGFVDYLLNGYQIRERGTPPRRSERGEIVTYHVANLND